MENINSGLPESFNLVNQLSGTFP